MNDDQPRHSWRCVEITSRPQSQGIDLDLPSLVTETTAGIHILYTHHRHIIWGVSPGPAPVSVRNALRGAKQAAGIEVPDWRAIAKASPDAVWQPTSPILLLRPDQADMPGATTIYSGLRKAVGDASLDGALFVLTSANVWEVLHDPTPLSQLVADPNVHEYLLWNDGGLCQPNASLDDAAAWLGAGWIGPRVRDRQGSGHRNLPPALANDFAEGLEALAVLQRRFADPDTATQVHRELDRYVEILGGFLPPFRGRDDRWLPSTPGQWGGVRPWRGIDDPQLNGSMRQLLLDGWLTLWKREDDYWYQPSSLILLYWVAQELHKRHTQTPTEFLEGYQWDRSPWFAGFWTS